MLEKKILKIRKKKINFTNFAQQHKSKLVSSITTYRYITLERCLYSRNGNVRKLVFSSYNKGFCIYTKI